ncbi:hypothetical protein F5876DRAFT_51558, partial [Lentinula aff. lateritia]
ASMSDKEIRKSYYSQSIRLDASLVGPFKGRVAMISPDAIAKSTVSSSSSDSELSSMELVRLSTHIPVPQGIRYLWSNEERSGCLIVQQFVPGQRLSLVWATMSWWRRFRVALTLRFYVHELRAFSYRIGPPPYPGPLSEHGPEICHGRLFTTSGDCGPFKSYREMSRWYQNRLLVLQRFGKADADVVQFDDTEPLVFTHFDIRMDNVIMGDDGQLWLIDWGESGWYPRLFESASMLKEAKMARAPWLSWVPFIAGNCNKPGQYPFIQAIAYALEVLTYIMNLVRLLLFFY